MFRSWTQGRCGARSVVPAGPLAVGGDVSSNTNSTGALKDSASSPWSPFRHASFSVVWGATVISNIGGWMYSAASGWLMTDLNPDPFIVSVVEVATTLQMFRVALTAPVWQSIVPQLVPRQDLSPAVAANSVGINVSRAVGPALGGVMVARIGIGAPFWFNAVSNLAVVGALLWWHPPEKGARLPVERFGSAIRIGFRHARNNPHLRATLVRAAAFFLFASAYWALLPLVARTQIAGGPDLYGYLLGAIGAAAAPGSTSRPRCTGRLRLLLPRSSMIA